MMIVEFSKNNRSQLSQRKLDGLNTKITAICGTTAKQISSSYPKRNYRYQIKVDAEKVKQVRRLLLWRGYRVSSFDEKYLRSTDYRKKFLGAHPASSYRCVYCGKIVPDWQMQVDHIIPVKKAQTNKRARKKLKEMGCASVNDLPNLVPSCRKCNQKKGYSMGLWAFRARIGKSEMLWKIRKVVRVIFRITMIAALCILLWSLI